ncbi:MAG: response regulator [Cyanobacteria bacterium J06621_8]
MHSNLNHNFDNQQLNLRPLVPLVLVVDNDSDNLLLASCVIESLGVGCVVTNDSEKCLDLVKKMLPRLILLDVVMPKLNGLEIASIIKQNPDTASIPIIAVTGLTREEDRAKLEQSGFDDYLSKPYLIEDLEAKLQFFLKNVAI